MMNKTAVAIKSCRKYSARRMAVRQTWLPELDCAEFFFIIGDGPDDVNERDLLQCAVSDAFTNIAPKILCACLYALGENYEHLVVLDDDTYVRPDRLAACGYQLHDYMGFLRVGPLGYNDDIPYAQGSAYTLSARAMEYIATATNIMVPGVIDDGAVGRALVDKVPFVHNWNFEPGPFWHNRFPAPTNNIITTHKCLPDEMVQAHAAWRK